MDFELSPDERQVQEEARRIALEEVAPHARACDEEGRFDRDVINAVGRSGLLGGPIASSYGGLGLGHVAQTLIYEELGRVDSAVRGFMAVQTGLVASCIQDWGTEEQKNAWLPKLCSAEAIGCYCLTEPGAGSDVASMQSMARRDGDHWVVDGNKVWITNGNVADVALVFAKTDPEAKHRGITAFLVPTATVGFVREQMTAKELGHRAADHARIRFDAMRIADADRLGEEGQGFEVAMTALDHGRLGVAAGAVGLHAACLVVKADGLKLEDSQMQDAGKLFKLAALAIAAAVRIIQLRDARDGSTRPATDVIEEGEIAAVAMIGKTLEGGTKRQQNHYEAGSLAWLAWIVARLGGWNCYYKPPGPKTMAAGWQKLATMLAAIKIAADAQGR